ncbi:hypothetical protein F2Q68_00012261 [Brassica cretica]|uniref:AB hydrolase-1 domain-containing protein n=1 Tax=Brassica cretica TaxID=69181 RepID=A0A8S9KZT4_BRACR|nr:hypothetical protein F2Q68_00012261 [Brassica cretica]
MHLMRKLEQGWRARKIALLILSLKKKSEERRPAVAYASRGYVAIGLDSRYHGERADSKTAYQDDLISSWKKGDTMPFIFDTVWDLIKLAEYLTQRKDIDPQRIGITGMHAWFAAAVDTRYSVVAPLIGVQLPKLSLVDVFFSLNQILISIAATTWTILICERMVFYLRRFFKFRKKNCMLKQGFDMGKNEIDKEVVEKVWDRIAPGLVSQFDEAYSVPVTAPRPLYLLNGAKDPRCPLGGLVVPLKRAKKGYKKTASPRNFKFVAEKGVGHRVTSFMIKETADWFDKFLKQGNMTSK